MRLVFPGGVCGVASTKSFVEFPRVKDRDFCEAACAIQFEEITIIHHHFSAIMIDQLYDESHRDGLSLGVNDALKIVEVDRRKGLHELARVIEKRFGAFKLAIGGAERHYAILCECVHDGVFVMIIEADKVTIDGDIFEFGFGERHVECPV